MNATSSKATIDEVLAPALEKRSLDAILMAVQHYASETQPARWPLFQPLPGLESDPSDGPTRELAPAEQGSWFHMLLYNAGNACWRAGEPHLALETYKQALLGFNHPAVFNNISAVLSEMGRFHESLMWLERAAILDPSYPQTFLNLLTLVITKELNGTDPAEYVAKFILAGGTRAFAEKHLAAVPAEERPLLEPFLQDLSGNVQ